MTKQLQHSSVCVVCVTIKCVGVRHSKNIVRSPKIKSGKSGKLSDEKRKSTVADRFLRSSGHRST